MLEECSGYVLVKPVLFIPGEITEEYEKTTENCQQTFNIIIHWSGFLNIYGDKLPEGFFWRYVPLVGICVWSYDFFLLFEYLLGKNLNNY